MATFTCSHNPPIMPFNSRDALAFDEMFQELEGDPLGDIEALLRDRVGSRRRSKTDRQKPS